MHFTASRLWCVTSFCGVVLPLLSGCYSGHHHPSRGVALSDAMAASASGHSTVTSGGHSYRSEPRHTYDANLSLAVTGGSAGGSVIGEGESRSESSSPGLPDDGDGYIIAFAAEEVFPIEHDIRNISRFELLPVVLQDEESYAGLFIGGGDVQFRSGSFPDQAITDTWLLDIGLVGRHYFTLPKTFVSPYFTGGVFGQMMFWDYRTPLNVGGDIINSDIIYGGGGYVGLGLALARKEHLGVFVEARLGFCLYDDATMQGFYNDVLDDYGYVSLRAGVSFKF